MDESTKFPHQIYTYSQSSPLYLYQPAGQKAAGLFVNNARVLATYLIAINQDNYHTLHVIDQPLDYIHTSRRGAQKSQRVKRPLTIDDLWSGDDAPASALLDFQEHFANLLANSLPAELAHARAYRDSQRSNRLALDRNQLNFDKLARAIRDKGQLKSKLFLVNESSSFNTYFLPVNSEPDDSLRALLDNPSALAYEAHIIPDQVLFTRALGLGVAHASLFDQSSATHRVSLSLAKTMPQSISPAGEVTPASDEQAPEQLGRRLLATPLLVQSKCTGLAGVYAAPSEAQWRSGVLSSELVLANIPVTSGVLHLIKRPLLVAQTTLLDYINDDDNQLSSIVGAQGSQTAKVSQQQQQPIRINRFRDLLVRERQILSTLSQEGNRTILVPSDEAFDRLKYDMRALVAGDEALIPAHWDSSYRRTLVERLIRRHLLPGQTLTSDLIESQSASLTDIASEGGKPVRFVANRKLSGAQESIVELQVESDTTRAQLIQHDLIGTNGVLHIIDRVLGEEEETVYSLLKSLVLKQSLDAAKLVSPASAHQQIQESLRMFRQQQAQSESISSAAAAAAATSQSSGPSAELSLVSRAIGQLLEQQTDERRVALATSVNISYHLARLSSLVDGADWNENFKQLDRMFTYFVPSDLAWLRLQQEHPELYKPLAYLLDQQDHEQQELQPAQNQPDMDQGGLAAVERKSSRLARSSESSQRLRQVSSAGQLINGAQLFIRRPL